MKYETSCGAVLYRNINGTYEYLVIKDRNDNYSFPKGHAEKDEKCTDCVKREVYEEVGLNIEPDEYFEYTVSYPLNDDIEKIVVYYMADIKDGKPFINDGEVKEIHILPYDEAYDLITYDLSKEILKEVNDRLVKGMKICCMFEKGAEFDRTNLELIKDYGDTFEGVPLYTWDEGGRTLFRCNKCGGYVLEQYSEIHMPDSTYIDYFPVRDESHSEEINRKYDGWTIETKYPYKKIFFTNNYDN